LVNFAFGFTTLSIEVVTLPFFTYLFNWRTFHEELVPQSLSWAYWFFASPSYWIKNRIITSAGAAIGLFDVCVVYFALVYTSLSSEVVGLPKLTLFVHW